MARVTRPERWLDRELTRAATPRRASVIIAAVTTAITIGAGLLMTIVDRHDFPTIGGGLWWAVQTVTTVGYGDKVPESTTGRILAAIVMLQGIGLVTVITAAITSSFVGRQRARSDSAAASEELRSIDARLSRIEAALAARDE
jgi:voltage-gated potassium channel Kch